MFAVDQSELLTRRLVWGKPIESSVVMCGRRYAGTGRLSIKTLQAVELDKRTGVQAHWPEHLFEFGEFEISEFGQRRSGDSLIVLLLAARLRLWIGG